MIILIPILNSSFTSNGTSHSFVAKSDLITFPVNKCLDATWLMKFAAIRNSGPSGILSLDRFVYRYHTNTNDYVKIKILFYIILKFVKVCLQKYSRKITKQNLKIRATFQLGKNMLNQSASNRVKSKLAKLERSD